MAKRHHRLHGEARVSLEAYDVDLEWFIVAGASAMGERGTLAGVVNVLEIGGGNTGGVPNTDLYTDQQVGLGRTLIGEVERHRWLSAAWDRLPAKTKGRLMACYVAPKAELRTDQGFGARDQSISYEESMRGGVEPMHGSHRDVRTGVDAQLGDCAGLAFWLISEEDDPKARGREYGRLLQACQQPSSGQNGRTIRRALRQAREVAREEHEAWSAAKASAPKPRARAERTAILPRYRPHEADQ